MSKILEAVGLTKVYQKKGAPRVTVLDALDFELRSGERVAILGRSGEGKSTLLHLLGTLETPTAGQVFFKGKEVFGFGDEALSAFRNQTLGFVFQFHYLLPEFTALENIMMPALIARTARSQAKQRALELLQRVGLAQRASHKPSQLSGGEQQRVSIARSLMMRPSLLLTDEMTGNLDSQTAREVFELVMELHEETGTAMVSVTHDEQLAQSYPRVMRLSGGQLR